MLSLRPTTSRLAARLRSPPPTITDDLPRVRIHEGGTLDRFKALALPDEYDRITGTLPYTTVAIEAAIARGGPSEHPPTFSYNLGPALIADGTVYFKDRHEVFRGGLAKPVAWGRAEHYAEAQLCNSSLTEGFFGHWLTDAPALMLLAEQRGLVPLSVLTDAGSPHRDGYTEMVGVDVRETRLAKVDALWLVDDRPTNPGRIARLQEVRRRVRRHGGQGARRVILDRKLGGKRRHLENAGALWEVLVREHGFEVIDPLALSHGDLVARLSNAEIVLGVEGSAMCHAVLASPDDALLFTIMPPGRFCTAIKWYTDMIGMRFGFVVAEGTDSDFIVPVDRMRRAITLAERSID